MIWNILGFLGSALALAIIVRDPSLVFESTEGRIFRCALLSVCGLAAFVSAFALLS